MHLECSSLAAATQQVSETKRMAERLLVYQAAFRCPGEQRHRLKPVYGSPVSPLHQDFHSPINPLQTENIQKLLAPLLSTDICFPCCYPLKNKASHLSV